MKKSTKKKRKSKGVLRPLLRMTIIQRVLFLLMLLMFAQYFLMLTGESAQDTLGIDVVHRSVTATIFGYFISGGFSRKGEKTASALPEPDQQLESSSQQDPDAQRASDMQPGSGSAENGVDAVQVWVVGCIGVLSLILLLMVRNIESLHQMMQNNSGIAALSQLRDFAAGSIAFLVSSAHPQQDGE